MKKLLLFLMLFILQLSAFAQPTTITYQGKLLDNTGLPINQTNVAITFAIYDAESGGAMLWPSGTATSKTVNIVAGLYSVTLGTGNGTDQAFTASIFAGESPWLEVNVGGSVMPRTPLANVPFALISNQLSTAGWASPGEIGSTAPNAGTFSDLTVGTGVTDYSLPIGRGTNGYFLKTNADGSTVWALAADGSETKVTAGTNVTMSGTGTSASPYIINSATPDGSETKVTAGTSVTMSGTGTTGSPYVINATTPDGSETKVNAGTNVTMSGSGTTGSPYIINTATPDGSETKVTAGTNVTVSGTGTTGNPYIINAIPSLTQVEILALVNPSNGFLVFCTTNNKFYSFILSDYEWKEIAFAAGNLRYQATYTIGSGSSCSNTTTYGTYVLGIALTAANTVTLQANVTAKGAWSITTNTINGFSFSGSGNFTSTGNVLVTLYASGTPTLTQNNTYTATANNSGGTCTFTLDMDDGSVLGLGGRRWMNRNLGASQIATSATDAASYGDLYEWGRASDGHEHINSTTWNGTASTSLPNQGNAWDSKFIINTALDDWLTTSTNTLWQGLNGTNNPCPSGFRLPTQAEWQTEIDAWGATEPINTPLKLPFAGYRDNYDGSKIYNFGGTLLGIYWSSDTNALPHNDLGMALTLLSPNSKAMGTARKGHGCSIRCIKN